MQARYEKFAIFGQYVTISQKRYKIRKQLGYYCDVIFNFNVQSKIEGLASQLSLLHEIKN